MLSQDSSIYSSLYGIYASRLAEEGQQPAVPEQTFLETTRQEPGIADLKPLREAGEAEFLPLCCLLLFHRLPDPALELRWKTLCSSGSAEPRAELLRELKKSQEFHASARLLQNDYYNDCYEEEGKRPGGLRQSLRSLFRRLRCVTVIRKSLLALDSLFRINYKLALVNNELRAMQTLQNAQNVALRIELKLLQQELDAQKAAVSRLEAALAEKEEK